MSKPKKKWYISRDGKAIGPYSWRVMQDMADDGDLKPTELVCDDTNPVWVAAKDVKDLMQDSKPASRQPFSSFLFAAILLYLFGHFFLAWRDFDGRRMQIDGEVIQFAGIGDATSKVRASLMGYSGIFASVLCIFASFAWPANRMPAMFVFGAIMIVAGGAGMAGLYPYFLAGCVLLVCGVIAFSAASVIAALRGK